MDDPRATACPLCGEPVPRDARRCDNCGADISAPEFEPLPGFSDATAVETTTPRHAGSRESNAEPPEDATPTAALLLCPSCGAFVSSADAGCPHCGEDLAEGSSVAPLPPPEDTDELAGLCPNCGSVAPTSRQTCAVCGASLRSARRDERASAPPRQDSRDGSIARPHAGTVQRPTPEPGRKSRRTTPPPPTRESSDVPPGARPSLSPETDAIIPAPRPVPRPERLPAPRGMPAEPRAESRLESMRDVAATATVIASLATAAAASVGVPGREWGQLFAFGALFGIGLTLLLPELPNFLRSRFHGLTALASLAIFVAVPLLGYAGLASAAGDAALLGIAAAGLVVTAWSARQTIGPSLVWTAGLLLLTVLSISPFVFAPPGPAPVEGVMWVLGGGMALAAASFLILRRWLRASTGRRLLRADAAYARRDYARAVQEYDAAITFGRRGGLAVPGGWYGKGAALVAAGRLDEALAALDRALALDPENEVAWINKGTALSRLGRTSEALKCYNSAIKVNPSYEVAWNNKGNTLARLGKPDLALACYERALEIDTGYRTAWVNKGFVLAKLGRFEEAAECADAALRLTSGAAASA